MKSGQPLTAGLCVFIQVEGINSLEALVPWLSGNLDITEMVKRMASCTVSADRVTLGTMQTKRVHNLVYWVKGHKKC